MSSNKEKINGYILAGGKSTRMGEDKGLMELHNKPVIEYVINQLKPAVNNIVIVSNNKEYAKFGYEVIEDIIRNIGPSAGIHTVLCHSKTERNFVVSCDMPFITTDSIEYLINESEGSQITIPVYKDKYEPMYAVYSKECLAQWEQLIRQGTYKMMDIINHFNVYKINVEDNPVFPNSIFLNINTKEDLMKALEKFVDKRG